MKAEYYIEPINFAEECHECAITLMVESCPTTNTPHDCEGVRIALGIPVSKRKQLELLKETLGLELTKDLMNLALSLYVHMAKMEKLGGGIGFQIAGSEEVHKVTFESHTHLG